MFNAKQEEMQAEYAAALESGEIMSPEVATARAEADMSATFSRMAEGMVQGMAGGMPASGYHPPASD